MRVHAIIHAAFEGLGAIQTWLDRKDFSLSVSHPYRGDQLPNPNTYDWLIIMGGPQDLKQIHKYPYLRDELSLIQQSIDLNKMVLGICLGAQLIAESLGAKTEPSPEKEIGIFPVNLTDSGHADPITRHFPDQFAVAHWHSDMPGLPDGATVLATSRGCPRQIICFKPQVYGLQCHFELTEENLREMLGSQPGDLGSGRYIQSRQELLQFSYLPINQNMWLFLDNFTKLNTSVSV